MNALLRSLQVKRLFYKRTSHKIFGITADHLVHRLSIIEGSTQPGLSEKTIPQHFSGIVSQHGDRPAVIARSPETPTLRPQVTTLSYRSLDEQSNKVARSLQQLGVHKGDRVAISLGNTTEFATLTYAVYKLGAVLVPLNYSFNVLQVKSALKHLGVSVLIIGAVADLAYKPGCGRSNLELLEELVPDLSGRNAADEIQTALIPSLRRIIVLDNLAHHSDISVAQTLTSLPHYQDLLHNSFGDVTPDSPLDNHDVVNIQFTSGTTAVPKAAMLPHRGILNNGLLIAQRMGLDPSDRIVVPPPLFHCFGSILGYMATATTGACIMFPSPAFDPVASLKMCVEHNATGLYGVATMLIAILDVLSEGKAIAEPPRHLVKGIVSGSSVPEVLMRQLYDRLGLSDLTICYGMTETAPVSCMTTPADDIIKRTTTLGRPLPHTNIKVVDPTDPSRILPVGESGELAVSGYLVMQGYWGDDTRTREVCIPDEHGVIWMHSGDECRIDEDGYIQIMGRIKDLIIRGGENIQPLEIENCILQHPYVLEVSVVGVPDEKLGECVGAFVIAKHGIKASNRTKEAGAIDDSEIKSWVSQTLSSHLIPKHIFWVEDFPKTASGKVQKFKLREMARELVAREH